jgi:hypothetical protein
VLTLDNRDESITSAYGKRKSVGPRDGSAGEANRLLLIGYTNDRLSNGEGGCVYLASFADARAIVHYPDGWRGDILVALVFGVSVWQLSPVVAGRRIDSAHGSAPVLLAVYR